MTVQNEPSRPLSYDEPSPSPSSSPRRRGEASPLLRGEAPLELDVAAWDDLPLVTRTGSFPLSSPTYRLSASDLKVYDEAEREPDPDWRDELRKLLVLMTPITLMHLLEYLPGLICIILVGHMDSPDTQLLVAASTMSTVFTNVSSLSIGFGLSSALDTLCAQAYGAARVDRIGLYLQAGLLVIGACLPPLFVLNWYTESFLLLVGQDADVARLAGAFSRITVVGMPFLFLYEMLRKVLQAQNIVRPLVVIMVLSNAINIVSGYYLTYHTELGFYGAALARTLGNTALALALLPWLWWVDGTATAWWTGWHLRAASQQVALFLRLGVPGMAMMAVEWWAFELLAVLAGLLPNSVLAVSAHAVLVNVAATIYMIFMGVSVSGSILVGNALGANQPKKARQLTRLSLGVAAAMGAAFALLMLLFRGSVPRLFLADDAGVARTATTLLALVPYIFVDALNCTMQGIYRGTGQQARAAQTNALAFYVVGLPLAVVLAFWLGLDVEGLWVGFGVGNLTALSVCGALLAGASWEQMAHEAQARLLLH